MNKYLFLDIDGVLNDDREKHFNGSRGTEPVLVWRLNQIIYATDTDIVVTSSWRRDVHRGHMTVTGLEIMLKTHGVNCGGRITGITDPDDRAGSRGELISLWLKTNARQHYRYVVIDDGSYWNPLLDDHGIRSAGHGDVFIRTDYRIGLTDADVMKVIRILNKEKS